MVEVEKAVARVRKKNIQAGGGGGRGLQWGFTAPPSNPPAVKFASLGDAYVRTNAKLNSCIFPCIPTIFLYCNFKCFMM